MSLEDTKRPKNYLNKATSNTNTKVAGTVFNLAKYNKWKKLYESGGNMRKAGIILNPAEAKSFLRLYKRGN